MFSPSPSNEPMTLGSPTSPSSTSPHSPYLPGYLLGDTPLSTKTSNQRLWGTPSGHSPPKQGFPGRNTTQQSPTSSFLTSPRQDLSATGAYGRTKPKTGAPPVQGLIHDITSPQQHAPSPITLQNSHFTSFSRQADQSLSTSRLHDSTAGFQDVHQSGLGHPSHSFIGHERSLRQSPPSPAQIDPFYTQGESIMPDDYLDETWVTVFGFPPAATSFILQQFSHFGNIVKHAIASEGNWMHIHYQSKIQAKKALSKNGKIFGNGIMIGVQPCIDKSVMEVDRDTSILQRSVLGTPVQNVGTGTPASGAKLPMRPLTVAYRAASSDNEIANTTRTPQKSSTVISKAMEYVFGW